MASTLVRHAFATHRYAISRSVATNVHIPSRQASTGVLLYGISALSNRHETQYFSKLSRLPLMEHSPTLKLIHTSEVQPGAPSTLSRSSQSGTPQEMEREKFEPRKSDAERRTGELSGGQVDEQVPDDKASPVSRGALSHRDKASYKREIAQLHKSLTRRKENELRLEALIKRHENLHLADKPLTKTENSSSRATRAVVIMAYGLALLVLGKWVYEQRPASMQEQGRQLQELQRSLNILLADLTSFVEQMENVKEKVAHGQNERQFGDEVSAQRIDDMESSALPRKPASIWSLLFWKKQE